MFAAISSPEMSPIEEVDFDEKLQCRIFPINTYITGFQCIWTIHNYPQIMKIVPNRKCIEMKEALDLSFGKNCFWTLWLYPNGTTKTIRQHIGLYFMFYKEQSDIKDVWALYQLKILDKNGNVAFTRESFLNSFTEKTKTGRTGYGHYDFVDVNYIEKQCLRLDGSVSFLVEGAIWFRKPNSENGDLNSLLKSCLGKLTLPLKILDSANQSDVIFSVGGQQFNLHKVILANASGVFRDMLQNKNNTSQNIIEVENVDPGVFRELIHFVYTSSVTQNFHKMANTLLVAADLFNVAELKFLCEKKLLQNICAENVAEYYLLASKYSAEILKKKTSDFIRENGNMVKKTQGWRFLLSDKDVALSLLELTLE